MHRLFFCFLAILLLTLPTSSQAHITDTTFVYLPVVRKTFVPPLLPESSLGVKIPVAGANVFFENQHINSTGELSLWVPPNMPVVRGIFFQNGSPIRPNPADPDWRNEVAQDRELAARQLASSWGFAYLSGSNWNEDNRSSYEQQEQLMQSALDEFAVATGHPELSTAPIAYMGGSRFAGFGPKFAARHPQRAIAYVIYVAGNSIAAPEVPGLMIVGEDDNGMDQINGSFYRDREQGALLSPALMWGVGHICSRCGDLGWPFLDAVVQLRVPTQANQPLRPITQESGWLGNVSDWNTIAPYNQYIGDKQTAAWFPNETIAQLWRGFMLNNPPATVKWPTNPYSWSNGFTQEPAPRFGNETRNLNSRTPFSITVNFSQAQSGEFHVFAGSRDLGAGVLSSDGKKLTVSNVLLPPGMHSLTARSGPNPVSWPAGLFVFP